MNNIADFIKSSADFYAAHCFSSNGHTSRKQCRSLMEFLSRHGRTFRKIDKGLPGDVPEGRRQECFRNCANVALLWGRYTYCEGYAMGIIPVIHAWLVDRNGIVIDPTWTGHKGKPDAGHDYFGVKIKLSYLAEHLRRSRLHTSVLDDWQHDFPILKTKVKDWKQP